MRAFCFASGEFHFEVGNALHLYILDALQCEWFCSSALWFDRQERCGSLPPNKLCKRDFSRFLHRHRVDMILIAVVAVMMIHALYCYSFSDSGLALTFSGVSVVIAALAYLLIRTLESRCAIRLKWRSWWV